MKKREAKYQTLFNKYLRESAKTGGGFGYYELKQTKSQSIPWSSVQPHQLAGLLASEIHGFIWKLSDEDQRRKPFDCISMPPATGFVVIKFPDGFYIIKANRFLVERNKSEGPSLTRQHASDIAFRIVRLT